MRLLQRLAAAIVLTASAATGAVAVAAPAQAASTSAYGCDYSYARPSVYTLDNPRVGSGVFCSWVARYLSGNGKGVTASEARTLRANGRNLVLNWEGTGREVLGGYSAGVQNARSAVYYRAAVGAPANTPVIFSVDFDLRDLNALAQWLNGAASILGTNEVGVYGSYRVVVAACSFGYSGRNWQAYAWSAGQWASPSCAPLRQVRNGIAGGSLDLDLQVGPYPFWSPGGTVANGPAPVVRATATAPVSSGQPTLRYGSRGAAVQTVQRAVGVTADGVFGTHTLAAVRTFQRAHGITVDGIVGPRTLAAILRTPVPSVVRTYRVQRGDTLAGIARKHRTTVSALSRTNHLVNPNRIYVGEVLRLT